MRLNAYTKMVKMVEDGEKELYVNWINYPTARLNKNENEITELRQLLINAGYTRDLRSIKEEYREEYKTNPAVGLPQETWSRN